LEQHRPGCFRPENVLPVPGLKRVVKRVACKTCCLSPGFKAGGGYVYHSDHSVPDDVSFADYKRVMRLVKRYGRYGG